MYVNKSFNRDDDPFRFFSVPPDPTHKPVFKLNRTFTTSMMQVYILVLFHMSANMFGHSL